MKIAIVRPLYDQTELEFQEPCGAQAICGFLAENGYDCRVFDRRIGATANDIERYKPDCVGFSVMTQEDVPDALRLLLELKDSGRHFFAGGLFVTTNPSKARALFPRDTFLISGEGELPSMNYLRSLENKPPLSKTFLDPNDWAFQSRDNIRLYIKKGGVLNIRSSRGCRGSCAFCTTPGLPSELRRFKARDISLVVDEIEAAVNRYGIEPVVNFTDDEFGGFERIEELVSELQRRNLRAAFSLELRAAEMLKGSASAWKDLHSGGLCRVFTGLESLNKNTLKEWKKPVKPGELLQSIEKCRSGGIECEVGYILWHPSQSVGGALGETEVLRRHGLFSPKAALSRLILFPGSELHSAFGKSGVVPAPLSGEAAKYYDRLKTVLDPLFELWSRCAVLLPNAACFSFLSGDSGRKDRLKSLLKKINGLAYEAVKTMKAPDSGSILKLRSEVDEACGAG